MQSETDSGPRQIHALTVYDGQLIAGGVFPEQGLLSTNGSARWDGLDWEPLGRGVGGGAVFATAVHNGELVAGGSFMTAGNRTFGSSGPLGPGRADGLGSPVAKRAVPRRSGRRRIGHHTQCRGDDRQRDRHGTPPGRHPEDRRRDHRAEDGELAIEGRVMAEEIGGTGFAYPARRRR